jgi:hypothetical protein
MGGFGGEERLTENITLNFAKVSLDYLPQDDKGAPEITITMTWDISRNRNDAKRSKLLCVVLSVGFSWSDTGQPAKIFDCRARCLAVRFQRSSAT